MAGVALVVTAPLLVALAALREARWSPVLDLAMTELRVRDVGGAHTPLIGLPGRIGTFAEQGSHPGPLSFWALAPVYRLLGSTSWALQVATVFVHLAAIGLAVWISRRRGGLALALAVGLALAVLVRSYGAGTMTEPWNPYLPLLWWMVVLLAVWSVMSGDLAMLPMVVLAGSFCAQTHAPYLGLTVGLGTIATAAALWRMGHQRMRERARSRRWIVLALATGLLLWAPPVIDQVTSSPGNLSILWDHFGTPPEPAIGTRQGVEQLLLHLDPWRLVTSRDAATGSLVEAAPTPTGSVLPGLVMLAGWLTTLAIAFRLDHRPLLRLHLVIAVALALASVSLGRIFGPVWYYLMMWAWGLTALMCLAMGWSVAAAVSSRLDQSLRRRAAVVGGSALLAATLVSTVLFTVDATDLQPPAPRLSGTVTRLVTPTVDLLSGARSSGPGRSGPYLVTWSDALHIGSQGYSMVNELERRGFDAGFAAIWASPGTEHRVVDPADAVAEVHLATGVHVERWRERPGVREVAAVDPRNGAERIEYERIRGEVIDGLRAAHLADVLTDVDENLFGASLHPRLPDSIQERMNRMLELGSLTAVFVGPPGAFS